MTNDRLRTQEEDYFRKRDLELIERIREKARANEAAAAMSSASGLSDPALVRELQDLGFTPETLSLLPLVPVVETAWAEGGVSAEERALIEKLAVARGIAAGSPAADQLRTWLASRPSETMFRGATRLIGAMLQSGSAAVADLTAEDLVAYCERIASASGGVFGFGKVSGEERELLRTIASGLKDRT
jgi:hypothetical protein